MWIDEQMFMKSPLIFSPVPDSIQRGSFMNYFEYFRRDVRNWWDSERGGREIVEPYLKNWNASFLVDFEEKNWEKVKLH